MCNKVELKIPCGYEIREKVQTLSINKATNLLLSGKQSEYSKAINNFDGTATLFYSVVKCPYCGCEIPTKLLCNKADIVDRDTISDWATGQLSLLKKEKFELRLNDKKPGSRSLHCPCCKRESTKAESFYDIILSKTKDKIKISLKLSDIGELFSVCQRACINLFPPFDYHEVIVFNLKKGRIYMQIEGNKNTPVYNEDITEKPKSLSKGTLYKLIGESQALKREIKKMFRQKASFPFYSKEITLEKLCLAARFVGYERNFYYTIPFLAGTYKLFPGFVKIAKKLHKAKNVPALYKTLMLPRNKSARGILFQSPGLLFYSRELKSLYDAIENIDYFNRILSSKNIYRILIKVNRYPVICEFLTEAFRYEIGSVVINQIINHFESLSLYAIKYMSMSDSAKKLERQNKKWLSLCPRLAHETDCNNVPDTIRCIPEKDIADCVIDGFEFSWLITTNDYREAGRKMHNCLLHTYEPVVAVKRGDTYIAAISLYIFDDKRMIGDALLCYNLPVRDNPKLYIAIKEWCQIYSIEWKENNEEN